MADKNKFEYVYQMLIQQQMTQNDICSVYFMVQEPFSGTVKIGKSVNVNKRTKELQTGNPDRIVMLHSIECQDSSAALKLESSLHKILQDRRLTGEWFTLTMEEIFGVYRGALVFPECVDGKKSVADRAINKHKNKKLQKADPVTNKHSLYVDPLSYVLDMNRLNIYGGVTQSNVYDKFIQKRKITGDIVSRQELYDVFSAYCTKHNLTPDSIIKVIKQLQSKNYISASAGAVKNSETNKSSTYYKLIKPANDLWVL